MIVCKWAWSSVCPIIFIYEAACTCVTLKSFAFKGTWDIREKMNDMEAYGDGYMEPEEEWEREGLLDPAWEKQQKKVSRFVLSSIHIILLLWTRLRFVYRIVQRVHTYIRTLTTNWLHFTVLLCGRYLSVSVVLHVRNSCRISMLFLQ